MSSPTETKVSLTLAHDVNKWSTVELRNSEGSIETGTTARGDGAAGMTAKAFSLSGSQEYSIKLTGLHEPHEIYTIKFKIRRGFLAPRLKDVDIISYVDTSDPEVKKAEREGFNLDGIIIV